MTDHTFPTSAGDDALTATEVRALLNVAIDLADDLGVDCAVVVVDAGGALRGAERPGACSACIGRLIARVSATGRSNR